MCLLYCLQDLKALGSSYLTLKNYFELIFADCICMILESGLGSFFHSFFTTETQVICCLRILLSDGFMLLKKANEHICVVSGVAGKELIT